MALKKYNWVGNQITDEDMCKLYQIKEKDGIPITKQVAEAVREYITRKRYPISNDIEVTVEPMRSPVDVVMGCGKVRVRKIKR